MRGFAEMVGAPAAMSTADAAGGTRGSAADTAAGALAAPRWFGCGMGCR